jgi:hypothetical protein
MSFHEEGVKKGRRRRFSAGEKSEGWHEVIEGNLDMNDLLIKI